MSILGSVIRRNAGQGKRIHFPRISPSEIQTRQIKSLLFKSLYTEFGQYHGFNEIVASGQRLLSSFQRQVPAVDYNTIYDRWWSRAHLQDQPNVVWPGKIPYYALSSGTSQAATKYIPVSYDMLRAMRLHSRNMFFNLKKYNLQARHFTRQMLMVGSSTNIQPEGKHYTGDLSGIMGVNRPIWISPYYRPGRHITDLPEWQDRIEAIIREARMWNIGFVVGNPAWVQMIFEGIIEKYGLKHVHELWPDFAVYVHSGIFFDPYKPVFEQLLGQPVDYINSYLASEGFIAYQNRPGTDSMRLLLNAGIYFEFVPFDQLNFDENGDLRSTQPRTLSLEEVREGDTYALLISTCSGAWRYLLGDTIQFTDTERCEIKLNGRTKQFLSVCGEHLSIDNISMAVESVNRNQRLGIREFCVAGIREGNRWAHQWWVGVDHTEASPDAFGREVDEILCRLNDDYAVERLYALKEVRVKFIPNKIFYDWLNAQGKMNGQAKVARVLKGKQLEHFQSFIAENL